MEAPPKKRTFGIIMIVISSLLGIMAISCGICSLVMHHLPILAAPASPKYINTPVRSWRTVSTSGLGIQAMRQLMPGERLVITRLI